MSNVAEMLSKKRTGKSSLDLQEGGCWGPYGSKLSRKVGWTFASYASRREGKGRKEMLATLLRSFPVKESREMGRKLEGNAGVKGRVY